MNKNTQDAQPGAAADRAALPFTVLQDRPDRLFVQLPNRLLVIAQELHTSPVVASQVWVKTGSIYEQEHVGAGLSHFLEHLVSGGTTSTRTEEQTNAILGAMGARTNAATSLATVRYYIDTTAPHAADAIELLADWVQNSVILQEEFDRERQVIQSEFAMGRGEPGRIFWKLTQQARYALHPARHPTIGYLDEFLSITRDEVYDFYKRMYVPNNMVFVVVGDIDRHAVVEQIARLFADAQPGPLPELSFPVEPAAESPREMTGVADIRRPRLRLTWPGTRLGGDGDYAMDLLATILGQGESSRLVRAIRDEQRLVTGISAYNLSFHWGEGFFGIDAEVVVPAPGADPANPEGLPAIAVQRVKSAVLAEIDRIRREGITPDELARAKRKTLASVIYQSQTASDLADRLATDVIAKGDPDYLDRYVQAVQKLTDKEVLAAADQFLAEQRMITVSLLPLSEGDKPEELKRPEEPEVEPADREEVLLDNIVLVDQFRAIAERGAAERAPIVTSKPQRFVLSNGLRLVVVKTTQIPAVAAQIYQVGGTLADPAGQFGLSNAMSEMRIKGTTTRTAQEIARQIEDLGASLGTSCGNNSFYAQAISLKDDWRTVLELLADVWINPTFPENEWALLQPRILAAIDRQNDSWSGELRQKFLKAYFDPAHPWSTTTVGERSVVEKLTAEDLRHWHRSVLGASEAVLAVVGDVEPSEVVALAEQLFGKMPEAPSIVFTPPIPGAPQPKVVQVTTNKGLAAVEIGFGPGVTRSSPDYAPLRVLGNVLSNFPSGWLEQELRGRGPGLVYAVGAGSVSGLVPGYFYVIFNSQPVSVLDALSRAMAVADRAREELPDAHTLERAKAAVLVDELMGKQTLGDIAADQALNWLYGLPEDATERFIADVQQLTPELTRVIARTYLQNPVVMVMSHQPLDAAALEAAAATKHQSSPPDIGE